MGLSLHARISLDLRSDGARRLDPALSIFPRLAWRAAADHLGRYLRHLGPRLHQASRLRTRSAGAGYPVPDNRTRRQPFGADARSVLRGVLPAARQGEGDSVVVLRVVCAVAIGDSDRRVRCAGYPAGAGAVPAETRDHRELLDRRDHRERADTQSDRLLLPRSAAHRSDRAPGAWLLQTPAGVDREADAGEERTN